jgi:hypothetical protein
MQEGNQTKAASEGWKKDTTVNCVAYQQDPPSEANGPKQPIMRRLELLRTVE